MPSSDARSISALSSSSDLIPTDDYAQPSEVASALGITEGTLTKWRHLRKGPPWAKIGKDLILYPRQGFRDFLKKQEVDPAKSKGRA